MSEPPLDPKPPAPVTASPAAKPAPAKPPAPADAPVESMADKIEQIHRKLVLERGTELSGLLEILGNRRRLMWLNFSAGLARGVGFFMGVTLIGALLLGGVALAFNAALSSLGFDDITLERAVKATVGKFTEIKHLVEEAQEEVHTEEVQRAEMDRLAPIEPEPGVEPAPHEGEPR